MQHFLEKEQEPETLSPSLPAFAALTGQEIHNRSEAKQGTEQMLPGRQYGPCLRGYANTGGVREAKQTEDSSWVQRLTKN